MRQFVPVASALSLALLFSSAAFAQQPANAPAGGTPEATAFDIPYGVSISGEKAKQVLAAAEGEAKCPLAMSFCMRMTSGASAFA